MKNIWNFLLRHSSWIIGVLASLWVLSLIFAYFNVILRIILIATLLTSLATGLSMFVLFAYTNINFTKQIIKGKDGEFNSVEQHGFYEVIKGVFIGVSIIVAMVVMAMYQSEILGALNGQ